MSTLATITTPTHKPSNIRSSENKSTTPIVYPAQAISGLVTKIRTGKPKIGNEISIQGESF